MTHSKVSLLIVEEEEEDKWEILREVETLSPLYNKVELGKEVVLLITIVGFRENLNATMYKVWTIL